MNIRKRESNRGLLKIILRLLTLVILIGVVIFVVNLKKSYDKPEISKSFISNKLEAASELTSAKMTYNGLIRYSDGKIPWLTKKAYTMTYRAELKAGIDLSKVQSNVTNSTVEIILPEVEILDIKIDTDSIQYYDEQSSLFNGETKTDAIESINMAKEDVTQNGDMDSLKAMAKSQNEVLIQELFKDCIGNRKLVIKTES